MVALCAGRIAKSVCLIELAGIRRRTPTRETNAEHSVVQRPVSAYPEMQHVTRSQSSPDRNVRRCPESASACALHTSASPLRASLRSGPSRAAKIRMSSWKSPQTAALLQSVHKRIEEAKSAAATRSSEQELALNKCLRDAFEKIDVDGGGTLDRRVR